MPNSRIIPTDNKVHIWNFFSFCAIVDLAHICRKKTFQLEGTTNYTATYNTMLRQKSHGINLNMGKLVPQAAGQVGTRQHLLAMRCLT